MKSGDGGCIVRSDELLPGDVLMPDGEGLIAAAIRALSKTRGPNSHVAILQSHIHLYEADEYGTGGTLLPIFKSKAGHNWVYLPYDKGTFSIHRHPKLQDLT